MNTTKTMDHAKYQERLRGLPAVALRHICRDAQEAINAMPDGPNAGYYMDEISYCGMELKRRQKSQHRWQGVVDDQLATLNQVYMILMDGGYCDDGHIIDGLQELVNDAERPADESGVDYKAKHAELVETILLWAKTPGNHGGNMKLVPRKEAECRL